MQTIIPEVLEGYLRGMNTQDSPKLLKEGEYQLIENAYPGRSLKPLNGVNDIIVDVAATGYDDGDDSHTIFLPYSLFIEGGDGHEYLFVWSQSVDDLTEYSLETWDLNNGKRTIIMRGDFDSNEVNFSMQKLYNSVYITFDAEMLTNRTNQYQTKNVIVYWDDDAADWAIRSMMIDVAPAFNEISVEDAAEMPWGGRREGGGVVHDGKMFIIRGLPDWGVDARELYTPDGVNWFDAGSDLGSTVIENNVRCLSYDNKIFMLGDAASPAVKSSSDNGKTWVTVQASPAYGSREKFGAVVYDNKMWVIGGNGGGLQNDVWYSTDGVTWIEATASAAFSARDRHICVVHNNKMFLIGGNDGANKDEVYSSTDGITWSLESAAATGESITINMGAVSFRGKIYITRDLWCYSSSDGATWVQEAEDTGYPTRSGHVMMVFQNKMWVLTGYGSAMLNDAWSSVDGETWVEAVGGLTDNKYYSCAATFIRRTDSDSVLSAIGDYDYKVWETWRGGTLVAVDEKLLTGVVSLSGNGDNNLTGVGTNFSEEISPGDYVRLDGSSTSYLIETVPDDTNASVVNADSDSYSSVEFSLLPTVGDPITTSVFLPGDGEGIEDIDNRQSILSYAVNNDSSRFFVTLQSIDDAVGQGATHVRYFRTVGDDTEAIAKGLPHVFVVDIAITGDSFTINKVFRDSLSDDVLGLRVNFLEVTGYSVPPLGRFSIWDGEKYWIGGIADLEGHWFYSVRAGTAGVSFDTQFPQKFASWFNLSGDYKTCDPSDGQKDAGIIMLGGDLYYFKERKIFVLHTADPLNKPVVVSSSPGNAFPNTLTKADIPVLGGEVVLFISEAGPAYLSPGGRAKLLTEFRIADLFPKGGFLKRFKTGSTADVTDWYSRNKASSVYWQNTWWVFGGDEVDSKCNLNEDADGLSTWKCFGFHFSPDGYAIGAFQRTFGAHNVSPPVNIYQPQVFVIVNSDNRLYTFSHAPDGGGDPHYRLTRFQDPTVWEDTYDEVTIENNIRTRTRYLFADPAMRIKYGKVGYVYVYIDFEDSDAFTILLTTDKVRQASVGTYSSTQNRQSGMISTNATEYRDMVIGIGRENMHPGRFFDIRINKEVPVDGNLEIFGEKILFSDIFEREPEFTYSFADPAGVETYVVKTGEDPEVDAHA